MKGRDISLIALPDSSRPHHADGAGAAVEATIAAAAPIYTLDASCTPHCLALCLLCAKGHCLVVRMEPRSWSFVAVPLILFASSITQSFTSVPRLVSQITLHQLLHNDNILKVTSHHSSWLANGWPATKTFRSVQAKVPLRGSSTALLRELLFLRRLQSVLGILCVECHYITIAAPGALGPLKNRFLCVLQNRTDNGKRSLCKLHLSE